MRQEWSPEQIAGRLHLERQPAVSHERIYQYIYADKRAGGTLHLCLRCQRKRRKRYGKHSRRGQIPNRMGVEARQAVVAAKRRLGDWEADTIIGTAHRQAILSLTERKSKLVRLKRVERNTAQAVTAASLVLLGELAARPHHHQRQWAGVRCPRGNRGWASGQILLRAPVCGMGARSEREHQRAGAPILPEEDRLLKDH